MRDYTFNVARDFSCNIIGECVPKNALFGKTQNYYWVFSDYAGLKNPVCYIHIGDKVHGWKTCIMRTDTQLAECLRRVTRANFGDDLPVVNNVLKMKTLRRPVRREPQRKFTPMKNTAYELRKQNSDNSIWRTNVCPNMDAPKKDHMVQPFNKCRPERKKIATPPRPDLNKITYCQA